MRLLSVPEGLVMALRVELVQMALILPLLVLLLLVVAVVLQEFTVILLQEDLAEVVMGTVLVTKDQMEQQVRVTQVPMVRSILSTVLVLVVGQVQHQ
jgi:hypothetical protein